MLIKDIKCAPPFNELFPVDRKVVDGLKASISRDGFSDAEPIIIWRGKDIIVDGHLRYLAAQELGYRNVPVFHMNFANEEEALRYAIKRQTLRRNLSDAEIIRCIEALDKRRQRGGDHKSMEYKDKSKAPNGAIDPGKTVKSNASDMSNSKSARETASIVGVSTRKVERARTVLDRADEEVKAAVKEGKLSIHRAYEITKSKTQPAAAPAEPENAPEVAVAAAAAASTQAQAAAPPDQESAATTALPEPQSEQPPPPPQSEQYEQDLRQALAELLAWRQKYRHLFELGNVFAVIDSFELCQIRLVKS